MKDCFDFQSSDLNAKARNIINENHKGFVKGRIFTRKTFPFCCCKQSRQGLVNMFTLNPLFFSKFYNLPNNIIFQSSYKKLGYQPIEDRVIFDKDMTTEHKAQIKMISLKTLKVPQFLKVHHHECQE